MGGTFNIIFLQIFLILLNAIFACAEIAIISMNESRISLLTSKGDKRASRISKLLKRPAKFLATIQVAITLAGFMASAFAAENFSDSLVNVFVNLGVELPEKTLNTFSVILITVILSYFTLIFGELVPKRIAMKKTESLALALSGFIIIISKIFAPIVWVLTASTNFILKILKMDPHSEDKNISEEEIRMMLDFGSKKGAILKEERDIIHRVFEFNDLDLGKVAVHRKDVILLWTDETTEKWEEKFHNSRHSIYPVCEDTIDNVVGVLNVKDYFSVKDRDVEFALKNLIKPAFMVPESLHADILFNKMRNSHNHFAIVIDEFGGVYGIVTMVDLVEQLVGDLEEKDKSELSSYLITNIDESNWEINGITPLEMVSEKLQVTLPLGEFETFGGYVFSIYGRIPDDGSVFETESENLKIKVLEIKDHIINKSIVSIK